MTITQDISFNSKIEISNLSIELFLSNLDSDDLFVFSPTSYKIIKNRISTNAFKINSRELGIEKDSIDFFIKGKCFKRVISLGNGKTTDIAKYIASQLDIELVSIPTALTTNVFFTDKACLLDNNKKRAILAKTPDKVFIDFDLLDRTPFKFHLYGLCDVLSIHTALFDWKLSNTKNAETIDMFLLKLAEFILEQLLNNRAIILRKDHESIRLIVELIMLSGYITNIAGSGRPESGSEHIVASFIEKQVNTFHAISVTAGILLIMELQANYSEAIFSALNDFGLLAELLKEDSIASTLSILPNNIQPRNDRYTVLNEKKVTNQDIRKAFSLLNSENQSENFHTIINSQALEAAII